MQKFLQFFKGVFKDLQFLGKVYIFVRVCITRIYILLVLNTNIQIIYIYYKEIREIEMLKCLENKMKNRKS
jgi:hypothetical protein